MLINGMNPGRLTIDRQTFMVLEPRDLLAVFGRLAVTRCEYHYHSQKFEYMAYSPDFEPVADAEIPPEYTVTITARYAPDTGKRLDPDITFERV